MKRVLVTGTAARTARICRFIVQSKDCGSTALRSLEDAQPPSWRRVEVPAEIALKDLHSVTQGRRVGRTPISSSSTSTARQIAGPGLGGGGECGARTVGAGREQLGDLALRGIKWFTYVYDIATTGPADAHCKVV